MYAPSPSRLRSQLSLLAALTPLWGLAYALLDPLASRLIAAFGLDGRAPLGAALHFFLYDAPKVLLLLVAAVFVLGVVQTFFSPERTRALLAGRRAGVGNVLAAALGIVTPFCSCSAVPLFIGFLSAGIPLGITFSFLVSAPMVNEVALVLLFGLFGWKIAALYLATGLAIAILAGLVIGRLGMENELDDWVRKVTCCAATPTEARDWSARIDTGVRHVRDIVGKVWLYVVIGIALGAGIHGYVPENFMAALMGREAWWSVPVAVLIGIPLYTGAAGIIPIVQALIAKGAALGTVLAFMMSVIGLSAPEMLILRRVMKPRLIATFVAVVGGGILLVGYLFNLVL